MTRVMRDSTTPGDIPLTGTQLAAGYANGTYGWDAQGWDRFTVPHVLIDVRATFPGADVLDVEPGCATPASAVPWIKKRLALKPEFKPEYPPVFYVNRAQRDELVSTLDRAGFTLKTHYRLWMATLDGTKTVEDMNGVCAVQWASATITGGHYDESIVYDDTWKKPPPTMTLTKADIGAVALAVAATHPPYPPLPSLPPPLDLDAVAERVVALLASRLSSHVL